MSIGKDVLRKVSPSKMTLTMKTPPPFDFLQLTMEWEKKTHRKPSEEELKQMWREYLIGKRLKVSRPKRKSKPKFSKKPYV
jgi:hypothetical protein